MTAALQKSRMRFWAGQVPPWGVDVVSSSQLVALVVAFAASALLTPLVRRLAVALGALDRPCHRSVHREPVPFLGGLAVYLAFAGAVVASLGLARTEVKGILLGGAFILAFGILDDFRPLLPRAKLAGQAGAALIGYALGVRIDFVTNPVGGGILHLGLLALPATLLWVLAVINVINLIDGLDGLAAGIVAIASFVLLVSAAQMGMPLPALTLATVLAAALAGGALGFLPYNFHPARIFLGDGGSMFLGYALASISMEGSLKSPAVLALAVPVLAIGLPVFDTALAIWRRWRRGVPIGTPDREHFHHRLLQAGLSQREVVLIMYLASAWLGVGVLALIHADTRVALFILALVGASLYFAARKVGVTASAREQSSH